MENVKFTCIPILKSETRRRTFVRCVSDSETDSFVVFGRHTIDTVTLVEVKACPKTPRTPPVVRDYRVLDRFSGIRNSVGKMETALMFCMVSLQSVVSFTTLLNSLLLLNYGDTDLAIVGFLKSVLTENGILNEDALSETERSVLLSPETHGGAELKATASALSSQLEEYIGKTLTWRHTP